MLRRELVCQLNALRYAINKRDAALLLNRRAGDCAPIKPRQPRLHFARHSVRQPLRVRYQHRARQCVVFRLRQQVDRAQRRVGCVVGDNHGLSGAVQPVNANIPIHQFLGERYEQVARPADNIRARQRFGAVSHSRDSLSAADAKHPVHARYGGGGKHSGVGLFARFRGRTHYDFAHARNARGYGGHQHG